MLHCTIILDKWVIFSYHYRTGYFFGVYDLSTSGKCGTNYVIPSIRVGHLRSKIQFNEALPFDMTLLVYCEFPSTLFIGKTGKIGGSYV